MEQTRGHEMFLLARGAMALHKTTPDGNDIVIRTVKPGEVFAEVILFEDNVYPVTAKALTAARVLELRRRDLLHLLDDADFRDDFICGLMRKQRYLADRVRYLAAYDVEERLLLFLKEQYGRQATITPDISKKDIAAAIGTTPETLSRLAQRLTQEGKLRWKGRTLYLDPKFWEAWLHANAGTHD